VGNRLEGKVAFITGAARGMGRAHAVRLASEGADIIAVDIAGPLPPCIKYDHATPEDLDETASLVARTGRRILASVADTRDYEALRGIVASGVSEFGRLDIVVANAGVATAQVWDEITPEAFRDVLDINVTGTWNTVMAGAPHIVKGGQGGSIILIGSAAGLKMQPVMVHYTTSKHAVTGMARAFAAELGKHYIRVNSVHPGPVQTAMGTGEMPAEMGRAIEANPALGSMLSMFLPYGMAEPDDVSGAVLWLASDDSRTVTAASIAVDQGTTQF
jgi:SDR family mycofactocin-dependent oxidoreductase